MLLAILLLKTVSSVNFKDGRSIQHDRLFGTDGVYSAVRGTMEKMIDSIILRNIFPMDIRRF